MVQCLLAKGCYSCFETIQALVYTWNASESSPSEVDPFTFGSVSVVLLIKLSIGSENYALLLCALMEGFCKFCDMYVITFFQSSFIWL